MDDTVIEALRQRREGMTLWQINEMFTGHKKSAELQACRARLLRFGRITVTYEETGGRPAERWRLVL